MNKDQIEIPLRKRHSYAYGMVLGVEDFKQEQSYLIDRMKLHNRMLHGYGTVTGLEVSASEDSTIGVIVSPGVAIDPLGNEIILPSAVQCPFPESEEEAYLVLYWAERDTDPVPVPGKETDEGQTVPSRVEEYAILTYEEVQSSAQDAGVVLAHLKNMKGKWKIDEEFRVHKVKP